jgi:hypothetical protein
MKTATVNGGIDELKGNNEVFGRGTGSTARVAIARAISAMLKSPSLHRKRFSSTMTFRGTITVTNSTTE